MKKQTLSDMYLIMNTQRRGVGGKRGTRRGTGVKA